MAEAYENAAVNSDLSLGGAHLVEAGTTGGAKKTPFYVCLMVVLKRVKAGGGRFDVMLDSKVPKLGA